MMIMIKKVMSAKLSTAEAINQWFISDIYCLHPRISLFLLDKGAEVNTKSSNDGSTALHYASKSYHPSSPAVVKLLFYKQAKKTNSYW